MINREDIPMDIFEKARKDFEYEQLYNRAKEIVEQDYKNMQKQKQKQHKLDLINNPQLMIQEKEIDKINSIRYHMDILDNYLIELKLDQLKGESGRYLIMRIKEQTREIYRIEHSDINYQTIETYLNNTPKYDMSNFDEY